jgi:hypothetical protein
MNSSFDPLCTAHFEAELIRIQTELGQWGFDCNGLDEPKYNRDIKSMETALRVARAESVQQHLDLVIQQPRPPAERKEWRYSCWLESALSVSWGRELRARNWEKRRKRRVGKSAENKFDLMAAIDSE